MNLFYFRFPRCSLAEWRVSGESAATCDHCHVFVSMDLYNLRRTVRIAACVVYELSGKLLDLLTPYRVPTQQDNELILFYEARFQEYVSKFETVHKDLEFEVIDQYGESELERVIEVAFGFLKDVVFPVRQRWRGGIPSITRQVPPLSFYYRAEEVPGDGESGADHDGDETFEQELTRRQEVSPTEVVSGLEDADSGQPVPGCPLCDSMNHVVEQCSWYRALLSLRDEARELLTTCCFFGPPLATSRGGDQYSAMYWSVCSVYAVCPGGEFFTSKHSHVFNIRPPDKIM